MAKPKPYSPETALDRILKALEGEVTSASNEEIAAALAELGMKLGMKGSAASADIRFRWLKRYGFDWRQFWRERGAAPRDDEDEDLTEETGKSRLHPLARE